MDAGINKEALFLIDEEQLKDELFTSKESGYRKFFKLRLEELGAKISNNVNSSFNEESQSSLLIQMSLVGLIV